jgi:hypothetical protein
MPLCLRSCLDKPYICRILPSFSLQRLRPETEYATRDADNNFRGPADTCGGSKRLALAPNLQGSLG